MLSKRIIPSLDVRNGLLTRDQVRGKRGYRDPVEAAREYYEEGADEIVFYDITASSDGRNILIDVVRRWPRRFHPLLRVEASGPGGHAEVILAGAEKVSVKSAAVENPS
jgi:cyclase